MGAHTKVVDGTASVKPALDWAYGLMLQGLAGGAVGIAIYRHEEDRNPEQNKKQWAMYQDISTQVIWHGEKLSPEDWKDILSSDWSKQRIVPGIGGGFVALGVRTSKLKKREMAELIEVVYAFGSEYGVKWSEPSLKEFEKYREAQQ
jgi:hypothetical protein